MGAGSPKLSTCVEMSGARKKKVCSGNFSASAARILRTYCSVGRWPFLRAMKISPSAAEMSAPSLSDRLRPL